MTDGGVSTARRVWAVVLTVLIAAALAVVLMAQNTVHLVALLPLQGLVVESVALALTPLLLGLVWAAASRHRRRVAVVSFVSAVVIGMICSGAVTALTSSGLMTTIARSPCSS